MAAVTTTAWAAWTSDPRRSHGAVGDCDSTEVARSARDGAPAFGGGAVTRGPSAWGPCGPRVWCSWVSRGRARLSEPAVVGHGAPCAVLPVVRAHCRWPGGPGGGPIADGRRVKRFDPPGVVSLHTLGPWGARRPGRERCEAFRPNGCRLASRPGPGGPGPGRPEPWRSGPGRPEPCRSGTGRPGPCRSGPGRPGLVAVDPAVLDPAAAAGWMTARGADQSMVKVTSSNSTRSPLSASSSNTITVHGPGVQ